MTTLHVYVKWNKYLYLASVLCKVYMYVHKVV